MVFALVSLDRGIIKAAYDLMGFFEPPIFVIVAAALFWRRANGWGAVACGCVGIGFNFLARFVLGMGAAEQTMLCFPICALVIVIFSLLRDLVKGPAALNAEALFSDLGRTTKPEPSVSGRVGVFWAAASLLAFVAASFGESALPKPGNMFIYLGLMMSFVFGCYLAVPAFLPESDEAVADAGSALERSALRRILGNGWTWLALYVFSVALMAVLYLL